jgi:hypothetical protein
MKSEYVLSKHRFYELKHFCLQYPEWEKLYFTLDGWPEEINKVVGDTTSRDGIKRADLARNMDMVHDICRNVCGDYADKVFKYVIFGSKPHLTASEMDFWYYYRKFFWELSRKRS